MLSLMSKSFFVLLKHLLVHKPNQPSVNFGSIALFSSLWPTLMNQNEPQETLVTETTMSSFDAIVIWLFIGQPEK